jgi:anti-repressor protein
MQALVRVSDDLTIDAKELHEALNVATKFQDWFQRRIEEYGFKEGEDFFSNLRKSSGMGRPTTEYALGIDMAKELCMVERTKIARDIRRYFIEVENSYRKLKSNDPLELAEAILANMKRQAQQLKHHDAEIVRLDAKIKEFDSDTGYTTILGYARRLGVNIPIEIAKKLGRRAAEHCRVFGHQTGWVKDERFGQVKSYPVEIVAMVFKKEL